MLYQPVINRCLVLYNNKAQVIIQMSRSSFLKKGRQSILVEKVKNDPFLTDEELAELLAVSVPTIRLDRLELGIPELRERIKNVAANNYSKVKSLQSKEIIGELIDVNLDKSAISILETDEGMTFEKTKIVRGHYIYSLAESIAIAVIDADAALVGVANIKYKTPVYAGSKLVAKAEVKRMKENKYIIWVKITERQTEVFRGKFILVSLGNNTKK